MDILDTLHDAIDTPAFLIGFLALMLPSLFWLIRDLQRRNTHLMPLMKVVWGLTVIYTGPLGLAIYLWSGRKEIATDSLPRRAFRSVAHCCSGCGMGEIVGVVVAAGILSLGSVWVSVITFALAYAAGYALTVGPLVQDGVPLRTAMRDAVVAETASITVMEVTAISVSLWLAAGAGMGDVRFWTALIVSLSCGLLAAYPVNVLLLHFGVKEGMMDPRMTDHDGHDHQGDPATAG
ncbi:DUF4396 domain-containing protein [Thalassococcus sp. BH17M4-6]|uniref:DUF4396 domain-containing protein n=1 Tax=Thalassococcus sp. BH17M4-6 TaxID=3413148 RepID=UPI003BED1A8D